MRALDYGREARPMYSEGNYRLRGSGLRAAHMVKINVPSDGRDTLRRGYLPRDINGACVNDQAAPHIGGCIPWCDLVLRLLAFLLSEEPLIINLLDLWYHGAD